MTVYVDEDAEISKYFYDEKIEDHDYFFISDFIFRPRVWKEGNQKMGLA